MKQDAFAELYRAYPDEAGFKVPGPSADAALTVDASGLRAAVLAYLTAHGPHTADETADALGRDVLSIRPRFSELRALGKLLDTHARRRNERSGKTATVWGVL